MAAMPAHASVFRALPSVAAVAAAIEAEGAPETLAAALAREAVDHLRAGLADGSLPSGERPELLAQAVAIASAALTAISAPTPMPVINATGTILHTGLGRAPLSARAQAAVTTILAGYCQVEFDLASGTRGDRQRHVAPLLQRLTGASAALVVNNCAGATVLVLQALAQQREVIVSRGELVEIGGSFRIPEIMAAAGCRLIEVGATNRTRLADYERAITSNTALLLKVHQSNFVQEGFVESTSTAELAALARARGIPLVVDQGSGQLGDLRAARVEAPTIADELAAGAGLVCASGDKLFGGPQAGMILGDAELVARCQRHPLARALRIDKLHLAALAGTLQDYLLGGTVPTVAMLQEPLTQVRARAEDLVARLGDTGAITLTIEADRAAVGSGASPTSGPDTWVVALRGSATTRLARALRTGTPPVVPRIARDAVLLDLRTVANDHIDALAEAVRAALAHG